MSLGCRSHFLLGRVLGFSRGLVSKLRFGLIGSALDLHLSDINIASLDKDLEEHDAHDLGLTGK